jgi:hypothetical protein
MTSEAQAHDTSGQASAPQYRERPNYPDCVRLRYIYWKALREVGPDASYPGLMEDFWHQIAAAVATAELPGAVPMVELVSDEGCAMTLQFDYELSPQEMLHSSERIVRGLIVKTQTDIYGQEYYEPDEEERAYLKELFEEGCRRQTETIRNRQMQRILDALADIDVCEDDEEEAVPGLDGLARRRTAR